MSEQERGIGMLDNKPETESSGDRIPPSGSVAVASALEDEKGFYIVDKKRYPNGRRVVMIWYGTKTADQITAERVFFAQAKSNLSVLEENLYEGVVKDPNN